MTISYHTLLHTTLFLICLGLLRLFVYLQPGIGMRMLSTLTYLSARTAYAYGTLALLTLIWLGTLSLIAWPHPVAHDEYAYRLAGDTFVRGRLVNPAHPLWRSFETFHVITQPFYAAKYPPAQGVVLAVGQWLGNQVIGLWLSFIGAVLAVYWLLRLMLPPVSAWVGGALVTVHPLIVLNWGMGFWGGALQVIGGALITGAAVQLLRGQRSAPVRRIGRTVRSGCSWVVPVRLAAGTLFLWYSRPYEGVIFSLLPLAVLAWAIWRDLQTRGFRYVACWLPGTLLLVLIGGGWLVYNQQITGHPLRFPYAEYYERYEQSRPLLFQPEGNPKADYIRPEMVRFHNTERDIFRERHTLPGLLEGIWRKLYLYGTFYTGLLLLIPLWAFGRKQWSATERYVVAATGLAVATNLVCTYEMPAYIATVTGALAVMIGRGLGWMQVRSQTPARRRWVRQAVAAFALGSVLTTLVEAQLLTHRKAWKDIEVRTVHETRLRQMGGKHVIIVQYNPDHATNREWVYNGPDIDAQPVIWAADRNETQNNALTAYYKGRSIWRVNPDNDPQRLELIQEKGVARFSDSR